MIYKNIDVCFCCYSLSILHPLSKCSYPYIHRTLTYVSACLFLGDFSSDIRFQRGFLSLAVFLCMHEVLIFLLLVHITRSSTVPSLSWQKARSCLFLQLGNITLRMYDISSFFTTWGFEPGFSDQIVY